MTVVAGVRARLVVSASRAGLLAQALTLPASGILAFTAGAAAPATPQLAPFIQLPVLGAPVSDVPGVKLILRNTSQATPVQPTLLNADGTVFNTAPFSIVEPGGALTSLGITNETASGKPTQRLKLALQNLVAVETGGFSIEVLAWQV